MKHIKEIKNFENLYQITDNGIVIALEKKIKMPNGGFKIIKEHYPKLSQTHRGYLKVMLTKNKIRKGFFVHRLVAKAFIKESNLQVNHIDKNKTNNNVSNLEFVTNRQNQIHRINKNKTSSKYTGVTKKNNKWQSQKMINGKNKYLGIFETEIEAYNKYLESYDGSSL